MLPIRWAAALFLFLLLQSQLVWSHEVRPSIFTLTFDQQRSFSISVSANVEALIAEIGADHDDTDDAPNANLYRTLRALPSSEMQERFKAFSPQWMSQLGLTFKGAPAALDLKQVDIPAVGDLELARESTILMVGQVPQGIDQMQWAYPEKFGASVLRIERPGQELQAQFYGAGTKSDVIKVGLAEPRSWAEKFFGLRGYRLHAYSSQRAGSHSFRAGIVSAEHQLASAFGAGNSLYPCPFGHAGARSLWDRHYFTGHRGAVDRTFHRLRGSGEFIHQPLACMAPGDRVPIWPAARPWLCRDLDRNRASQV